VALFAAALALGAAPAAAAARGPHLDVLFVGAHPDDESGALSTFGAWAEERAVQTGVLTITRGEGGGNAAGPEEGPALGLLREAEERRAVGRAGIRSVFSLDEVDFFYTVSAPLTRSVWGDRGTLERVVRIVRQTRPEVIVTMNPAPAPGEHGHHQLAARLAVEAYAAAADPAAFRGQITGEGLRPWRVRRLFRDGADGEGATGRACPGRFAPDEPTDEVFGVWEGRRTRSGRTWAQVEREAQRDYVSQGWAGFEDPPADPAKLGCDVFTQLAARVPFTPRDPRRDAILEGALRTRPGGLPLGTELFLTAGSFDVVPGRRVALTVHARGPRRLGPASVRLRLPAGWRGPQRVRLGGLGPGREARATVRVAVPEDARAGRRVRVGAVLTAGGRSGTTRHVLWVVPPVRGTLAPAPRVADFLAWTARTGLERLATLEPAVVVASGGTRSVRVDVRNGSGGRRAGTVALRLPPGFTADAAEKPFPALAPGARGTVAFAVTNTDPRLATSEAGGERPFEVVTAGGGERSVERATLELVPATAIPRAAPVVDGAEAPGEYPGPALDAGRRWEGEAPRDAADASATAKAAWTPDALHLLVRVADDALGTVLPAADARRHWRTDAVEITVDPRGDAVDTASTYKVGVFPVTAEGGPAAARDADNRQGPAAQASPGLRVASRLGDPYDGYTLEVAIPFADLPAAVAPGGFGLDVLVYDSDTQDKTGQTRIGWSAWGGVQGEPARWGRATLAGPGVPSGGPPAPLAPVIPRAAARSLDSPPAVLQAARQGLPLGGGREARTRMRIAGRPRWSGGAVSVVLRASGPGVAHVFATAGRRAGRGVGSRIVRVRRGTTRVRVPVRGAARPRAVAVGFAAPAGGTRAVSARVRP
jgi:LmbE family N-acetylglucosaminyl deacetylase